ncbi:hypothetical protein [Aequorivita marisscotiae]|uniref:TonB-dependent receptor n=1 Tax=Aequorivita marisscotiae TaxID=3040348 RepID=A0ABY8KWQ5_9FLAO|nr:hypothetical protein [Aequorivita sp. Ant34-E75]WGF92287.1 hypothetical protein QCQ61_13890 [Aequorivita sp. Ant34-E75]
MFLLVGLAAMAQIPKEEILLDTGVFPKENVKLSVNSKVLLAGELLQYKAYNLTASNKMSNLSKILYVSLRNATDSVVFNHKLQVNHGTAHGDFFIPSNLKTGIYKLIGYTNFSKNSSSDAFAQVDLYIVNTFVKSELMPSSKETVVMTSSTEEDLQNLKTRQDLNSLTIKLNKKTFGLREKVTLTIENPEPSINGNYVLSVRKINPVKISGDVAKATKVTASEVFYIPELRGELISGVVVSKLNNTPAANKEVALTIPGKDYIFKIATTNAQGRFYFAIDEPYNAETSILQLYGDEAMRNTYKMVLDSKDFKITGKPQRTLKLEPQLEPWLEERSVQLQVENAYYNTKKDSILSHKAKPAFYDNLGTVFLLDDYTRFSTVRETFVEVITLAAIRGSGDDAKFVVNNAYDPNRLAKFNRIDPLVLLDGVLIQDNAELLNYNARNIESVRVVTEPYRYGAKIYSGIIAIESKSGDYSPAATTHEYITEINLPPVVGEKRYYRPDYGAGTQLSRIPDYRVQLLWQPEINISSKDFTTAFYTSDVSGVFEILIEGFTEQGVYFSDKHHFSVTEN